VAKTTRITATITQLIGTALLGWALQAQAAGPSSDAALEQRVNTLARELRCVVCQNQTLADSQADLAQDMKQLVREQLAAGKSETEVVSFMVQRYGDFVRYRPPVQPNTWLLWAGPLALALAGLGVLGLRLRRQAQAPEPALPHATHEAAAALLAAGPEPKDPS